MEVKVFSTSWYSASLISFNERNCFNIDSCILYLNNFALFIFPLYSFSSTFIKKSCSSCRVTASLVFHHLFRPGSFPGSIIIKNSIFATKIPLSDHSQIFIAHAFASISFWYHFHFASRCRKAIMQAVLAYLLYSSSVSFVLQDKYEIFKVQRLLFSYQFTKGSSSDKNYAILNFSILVINFVSSLRLNVSSTQ